ncbi:hypothetical protein KBZ15_15165 [Cyanobium sp. BA20m-p-22]|uniref:hypothetical protein n=1 Tax=Cyanobium sp. BA20m-p-22 TaxID=2823704 RepID=UPI0020CFAD93|nr:hypothetical protein [Cyanobium sp. BA20m-p-22]MCP9911232.1 hypothetical protein [Cyanobium sp. BA20m-p-22]
MRRLLIAAGVLMASSAFAGANPECFTPHGSSSVTAKWSSKGKIIEEYLTTSDGDRYNCRPEVFQNSPSARVGSVNYSKQVCGPLTIVSEQSYRNCTYEESAGISRKYDPSGFIGSMSRRKCATALPVSETRYELRDKNGEKFQLGIVYEVGGGGDRKLNLVDICTSDRRTQTFTSTWRVGSTSKEISLTYRMEYQAEGIRQPSL